MSKKPVQDDIEPVEVYLCKTCSSGPEQYDAYVGTEKVGCIRVRYGYMDVAYRDKAVSYVRVRDLLPAEREPLLQQATEVIKQRYIEENTL